MFALNYILGKSILNYENTGVYVYIESLYICILMLYVKWNKYFCHTYVDIVVCRRKQLYIIDPVTKKQRPASKSVSLDHELIVEITAHQVEETDGGTIDHHWMAPGVLVAQ